MFQWPLTIQDRGTRRSGGRSNAFDSTRVYPSVDSTTTRTQSFSALLGEKKKMHVVKKASNGSGSGRRIDIRMYAPQNTVRSLDFCFFINTF